MRSVRQILARSALGEPSPDPSRVGDVVIAALRPCEDLPYEWYRYAARHSVYPAGDEDEILRALGGLPQT